MNTNVIDKKQCEMSIYVHKFVMSAKNKAKKTQMAYYFYRDAEACINYTLFRRTSYICVERRCIWRPNAIPKPADGGINACGNSLGINPKENDMCNVFFEDIRHRVSPFERESLQHQLSSNRQADA